MMPAPLPGSSELHRAMTESLNWREPGATIVPTIPTRRRFGWRLSRWVLRLLRWGRA